MYNYHLTFVQICLIQHIFLQSFPPEIADSSTLLSLLLAEVAGQDGAQISLSSPPINNKVMSSVCAR